MLLMTILWLFFCADGVLPSGIGERNKRETALEVSFSGSGNTVKNENLLLKK